MLAVAVATAALVAVRSEPERTPLARGLVLGAVGAGALSGPLAATLTAGAAAAALNLFLVPDDWVAVAVFLAVAVAAGLVVAAEAERRRAAEARGTELQALNDRLNQLTAEREALEADASRAHVLARVDEQRAALLRSVSHDLRTPLATIRAVATDLRDGADYDAATRTELLSTVCDETERLDRIVSNLLSLSRIEAGALKPERQAVPVDELVADRVRRLTPLFKHVRIQVELPAGLPLVDADYTQLDLVVSNLLENAARHAPEGSRVRISGREREAMVELRVADEGIGVPEYARTTIFEPFRRGERGGPSGVGLAICRAIVEEHGGTIRVDRTVGGGATFVFTVPVHRVERR
ncbi:MAG: sensor histidine kinase [Acidimicrobiales bacterium]